MFFVNDRRFDWAVCPYDAGHFFMPSIQSDVDPPRLILTAEQPNIHELKCEKVASAYSGANPQTALSFPTPVVGKDIKPVDYRRRSISNTTSLKLKTIFTRAQTNATGRTSADRRKYIGGPGEDWAARARRGDEAMPKVMSSESQRSSSTVSMHQMHRLRVLTA